MLLYWKKDEPLFIYILVVLIVVAASFSLVCLATFMFHLFELFFFYVLICHFERARSMFRLDLHIHNHHGTIGVVEIVGNMKRRRQHLGQLGRHAETIFFFSSLKVCQIFFQIILSEWNLKVIIENWSHFLSPARLVIFDRKMISRDTHILTKLLIDLRHILFHYVAAKHKNLSL